MAQSLLEGSCNKGRAEGGQTVAGDSVFQHGLLVAPQPCGLSCPPEAGQLAFQLPLAYGTLEPENRCRLAWGYYGLGTWNGVR